MRKGKPHHQSNRTAFWVALLLGVLVLLYIQWPRISGTEELRSSDTERLQSTGPQGSKSSEVPRPKSPKTEGVTGPHSAMGARDLEDSKDPTASGSQGRGAEAIGAEERWDARGKGLVAQESEPGGIGSQAKSQAAGGIKIWKEQLDTSKGPLEVKRFGNPDDPLAIMLHGAAPHLVGEWEKVAEVLAKNGIQGIIPNFHFNSELRPSVHGKNAEAISKLITKYSKGNGVVLMGKSWGGGLAIDYAKKHADKIKQLVLVAPAGATESTAQEIQVKKVSETRSQGSRSFAGSRS